MATVSVLLYKKMEVKYFQCVCLTWTFFAYFWFVFAEFKRF